MANATKRGVVYSGIPFNMTVQDLPVPSITSGTDAIVRMSTSAICGTDLHVYHGIWGSTTVPYTMGHEGIGVVTEIGDQVQELAVGDHVIVPDNQWGLGLDFGLDQGLQSEYIQVPSADGYLIPFPSKNATYDINYMLVSDIWSTAWVGLDYAGFQANDSVVIFGAGPVGLLAAYSAILRGASRVYSVDQVADRLELARSIGSTPINFAESDPVEQILALEPNGVDRSVDCVGFEAVNAQNETQSNIIWEAMIDVTRAGGGTGGIGIFGASAVSPGTPNGARFQDDIQFPMSSFFGKRLSHQAGAVDITQAVPALMDLLADGQADGTFIISKIIGIEEAPVYYDRFDKHLETKVVIQFPEA